MKKDKRERQVRGGGEISKSKFCLTRVTDKKLIGANNKTDVKKDRITYVDKSTPVRGKV